MKIKKRVEEDHMLDKLATTRDTPRAKFASHILAWRRMREV